MAHNVAPSADSPYFSLPVPLAQPEHLAAIGRLRGMQPADAASARVLELGCSNGQNLLPLAERDPHGTFLGIDHSASDIALARRTAEHLDLGNVEFRCQNLLALGRGLGPFDYIIAADVYSRVAGPVRDKILEICHECLAPQGIAYVSYKTYPGCYVHDVFRDMMLFNARGAGDQQMARARALLQFLDASLIGQRPFDALVRGEVGTLLSQPDALLRHEYLGDVNQPVYYRQFIAHAQAHGLAPLGDCSLGIRASDYLSPAAEERLHEITTDPVVKEQYRDIVRNRSARQALLCHANVELQRSPTAELLQGLYLESRLKCEEGEARLDSSVARFATPGGLQISTGHPLVKAALVELGSRWPDYVAWQDLVAVACRAIEATTDPATVVEPAEVKRLEDNLLQCCAGGVIELHGQGAAFTPRVSPLPAAGRLARWQAEYSDIVINRKHRAIRLAYFEQQVLQLVDGTRNFAGLVDELTAWALAGRLVLSEGDATLADPQRIREVLAAALPASLSLLAYNAFLID